MKTFLCEYIHEEARKELASFSEILDDWERLSEADALISRNLQLTKEVLEQATSLKIIAVHGTGMDGVDLEAAKRRGIRVISAPHRNAASVAELNIALMLSAARKLSLSNQLLSEGRTTAEPEVAMALSGIELAGKTAAFLGVGEIAKRTAYICRHGFGMRLIGWSRSLSRETAEELGMEYAETITEAVKEADFVLPCMALCEETKGIIGRDVFAAMKQGAYLINTARGGLLNEAALEEAIRNRRLAGAALDVITEEPLTKHHPLYRLPQVVLTPHIGANTEEALYRVGMACVDGIRNFVSKM